MRLGHYPPTLLIAQLAKNGFAVVNKPMKTTILESIDFISDWFQLPAETKQAAAAAAGRGLFTLPDMRCWR
jgi:hypothetical protein